MRFKDLLTQRGLSLLQLMVAAAALAGGSVYVLRSSRTQEKIGKAPVHKVEQSFLRREISEALTDVDSCTTTIAKAGSQVLSNMVLDGIYSKAGSAMYRPGDEFFQQKLNSLKLKINTPGYALDGAMKLVQADLLLGISKNNMKTNDNASFGGQDFIHKIPLYLVVYKDAIFSCMADDGSAISSSLQAACAQFGGTYNTVSGVCEGIHGNNGVVMSYLRTHFCTTNPGACPYPYANTTCPMVPTRDNSTVNNWVIDGFDGIGNEHCVCVPRDCPDPSLYCQGVDLGTDWCTKDCGTGVKTSEDCNLGSNPPPPPPPCQPSQWAPDTSTQCSGVQFTQFSNCPNVTRSATGTSTSGTCASCTPTTWAPDPATVCSGQTFTQTSDCPGITRNFGGTKSCPNANCTDSTWTPDATTICTGKSFTQTSNCNNTRTADGAGTCCTLRHGSMWSGSNGRYQCNENNMDMSQTFDIPDGGYWTVMGGLNGTHGTLRYYCSNGIARRSTDPQETFCDQGIWP